MGAFFEKLLASLRKESNVPTFLAGFPDIEVGEKHDRGIRMQSTPSSQARPASRMERNAVSRRVQAPQPR